MMHAHEHNYPAEIKAIIRMKSSINHHKLRKTEGKHAMERAIITTMEYGIQVVRRLDPARDGTSRSCMALPKQSMKITSPKNQEASRIRDLRNWDFRVLV